MSADDPLLQLAGWHAEPLLVRRLRLYIVAGLLEYCIMLVCIGMSAAYLQPAVLFIRLLILPCAVVMLKACWAMHLFWSYCRFKSASIAIVVRQMRHVHSRSFWSCSAAALACFSCLLMVWHAVLLVLMTCYQSGLTPTHDESFVIRFLMCSSAVFAVVNLAFWKDFVRNDKETSASEEADIVKIHHIYQMYKAKKMELLKYKQLVGDKTIEVPKTCVVCLEEFVPDDDVSRLSCKHSFHPACAHKWILEDWRCPLRCSLETPHPPKARVAEAEVDSQWDAFRWDLETGMVGVMVW